MRQTKLLLLLLLALVMSATGAFAQTVGTQFTVDGITYEITKQDLSAAHDNEVTIVSIGGSGTVNVPESVKNERNQEFYKVTSTKEGSTVKGGVTNVVFPNTLTKISQGSFNQNAGGSNAPDLQSITIPANCTEIGLSFSTLPKLTTFVVADGNPNFKSQDGMLMSKNGKKLVNYPSGRTGEASVPDGVEEIAPGAFAGCTKVTNVNIPASCTTMHFPDATTGETSFSATGTHYTVAPGNPAYKDIDGVLVTQDGKKLCAFPFHYDVSLPGKKYTVPAGVEEIAYKAFYTSTPQPVSVDLNEVKKIGKEAFSGCSDLASVTIGKNVNEIGEGAFAECRKISAFTVDEANTTYKDVDGVIFTKNGEHLMLYPAAKTGDYITPAGTKYIDAQAFRSVAQLKNITIGNSVERIEESAFRYSLLESVTFEETSKVNFIGHHAFNDTKLTNVTLPAALKTLGAAAFYNIQTLQEVHVQDGSQLTQIGGSAFRNNPNLTTFKFDGSSVASYIGVQAFANDPKLTSFEIPATTTFIDQGAFQNTPSLETVTFGQPSEIETINTGAFAYSGIKNIELPTSVKYLKQQAFDNCTNLETIKIPASVTDIATGTFNMCENLLHIDVDDNNPKYASLAGMLTNKDKTKLVVFPAGRSSDKYTMIPNIATVEPYAFYGSKKLDNITVPKTVTTISDRAIALCTNLKSISFMGEESIPQLSADIMYQSSNPENITIFVRKKWYEDLANNSLIDAYNGVFKEVHPSFISQSGYDRGTEFFPTSMTNAGVISFYTPRTSVIIDKNATENSSDSSRGKTWTGNYNVSSVLDFAYEGENTVKDIVFLADIGVVGLDAFKSGSQLKGIYFVGDTPGTLNCIDYEHPENYPFNDGQAIYVKESKVSAYQDAWTQGHTLNITYKIPATTLAYRATACYPFDVVYNTSGDVMPYLPLQYKRMTQMSQDKAYVRAKSIDNGYVPAFFGVMLASENSASASSYCQMDETQSHTAISDADYDAATYYMVGVVEDTPIANTTSNTLFGLSKSGVFKKISDSGNTIPYFKAYLSIPNADIPMGAKSIQFFFGDFDSETTGIGGITENSKDSDNAPYYNLNGVQVNKPSKGVYIHNGKKIIIK